MTHAIELHNVVKVAAALQLVGLADREKHKPIHMDKGRLAQGGARHAA